MYYRFNISTNQDKKMKNTIKYHLNHMQTNVILTNKRHTHAQSNYTNTKLKARFRHLLCYLTSYTQTHKFHTLITSSNINHFQKFFQIAKLVINLNNQSLKVHHNINMTWNKVSFRMWKLPCYLLRADYNSQRRCSDTFGRCDGILNDQMIT